MPDACEEKESRASSLTPSGTVRDCSIALHTHTFFTLNASLHSPHARGHLLLALFVSTDHEHQRKEIPSARARAWAHAMTHADTAARAASSNVGLSTSESAPGGGTGPEAWFRLGGGDGNGGVAGSVSGGFAAFSLRLATTTISGTGARSGSASRRAGRSSDGNNGMAFVFWRSGMMRKRS